MDDKLRDKDWLEAEVAKLPVRHVARNLGVPYSRAYTAVKKFGIKIPMRNGYIFTEESRKRKSEASKAAIRKKYPNGRFGKDHPGWKGGRRKSPYGYTLVYNLDHPRSHNGVVFEHILIAEKTLGRPLKPNEIVHHLNHIKTDNRPENLQVVTRSQHVHNHFDTGHKLVKRIAYLERLLLDNHIAFK